MTLSIRTVSAATVTPYRQATITWKTVSNVQGYNIYYRAVGEKTYSNAVRRLSPSSFRLTIGFLKRNTRYVYQIAALDQNWKEYNWTPLKTM